MVGLLLGIFNVSRGISSIDAALVELASHQGRSSTAVARKLAWGSWRFGDPHNDRHVGFVLFHASTSVFPPSKLQPLLVLFLSSPLTCLSLIGAPTRSSSSSSPSISSSLFSRFNQCSGKDADPIASPPSQPRSIFFSYSRFWPDRSFSKVTAPKDLSRLPLLDHSFPSLLSRTWFDGNSDEVRLLFAVGLGV